MKILSVSREDQKVLRDLMDTKHKIHAIKRLRDLSSCGLKEAKQALEHMTGQLATPIAKIRLPWVVESLIVVDPDGKRVELSIKDLELKFLQETPTIGLDYVADLLDLTSYLKEWQAGRFEAT